MANPINVKDRFLRDESKEAELEIALAAALNTSATVKREKGQSRAIEYGRPGRSLRVEYNTRGKISKIWCEPKLASELEKQIEDAIYTDHGKEVRYIHIFTQHWVKSYFRAWHDFQIIPVPPSAPQPKMPDGGYPAILEFSFDTSPSMSVKFERMNKRRDEIFYFLAATLNCGIRRIEDTQTHHWILAGEFGDNPHIEYGPEQYGCDEGWPEKDEIGFSVMPDDVGAMELVAPQKYISEQYVSQGGGLCLPVNVHYRFAITQVLDSESRAKFLNASRWFQKSYISLPISQSLAYCSLIFAIESLIPEAEDAEKCSECGQEKNEHTTTQKFKRFIREYAPEVKENFIAALYDYRSKIAHGSSLLPHDGESGFRHSYDISDSQHAYRATVNICQVVMVNWLMRHVEDSGGEQGARS
ncbi:hypothetical protein LCM28_05580 [Salipiger pacificus]|nr:hypothetical protein [Alloyangia pacifica]